MKWKTCDRRSKNMEDSVQQVELVQQSPASTTLATLNTEKKPGVRPSSESELSLPSSKILKTSPSPRATRSSINPAFAAKQRKFLNRVHDPTRTIDDETSQDSTLVVSLNCEKKRKAETDTSYSEKETEVEELSKKKKTKESVFQPTKVVGGVDSFCWICHRDKNVIRCESCPRVYHVKCLHLAAAPPSGYMCPECSTITEAEDTDTRSRAMRMLTIDQLCNFLQFALKRMLTHEDSEEFMKPVDTTLFPNYLDFIVKPMDLTQLKNNIKAKMYGSTEAFLADTKWILHNSCIFNSAQSHFSNAARTLVRYCKEEMEEIEKCTDCYQLSNTRPNPWWFTEPCTRPHVLVWAKLRSFSFWPAKVMSTNKEGLVDVRFFGDHNRARVPVRSCLLFSEEHPVQSANKNKHLEDSIQEVKIHIRKLRIKFGQFEFPPSKTPYDPDNHEAQLAMFLPKYEEKIPGKQSSRLSLHHDGARKSLVAVSVTSASSPLTNNTSNTVESSANNAKECIVTESSSDNTTNSISTESIIDGKEDTTKPKVVPIPMVNVFDPKKKQITPVDAPSPVSKTPMRCAKLKVAKKIPLNSSTSRKHGTSPGTKTSPKIPLTAAAKKCFATEKEKSCLKCLRTTTSALSIDSAGQCLCSSSTPTPVKVSLSQDKSCVRCKASNINSTHGDICSECSMSTPKRVGDEPDDQGTSCAHCLTSIAMSWSKGPNGLVLCSSCRALERLIKEKEKLIPEETVNVENENNLLLTGKKPSNCEVEDLPSITDLDIVQTHDKDSTQLDGQESLIKDKESDISVAANDTFAIEIPAVDSPPKFVIPKKFGDDLPNTTKKVSVAGEFWKQNNVCYAVEEAIKIADNAAYEEKTTGHNVTAKTTDEESPLMVQETAETVLIHGVKNSQESSAKINETPKVTQNNGGIGSEVEMETSSESSSEIDSDIDGVISDLGFALNNEQGNKKKKEININNVVRSLTERKTSVDEELMHNNSNENKSNTLTLDDFNDESSALLINESGDSSNESKKTSKPDKSRRKGIPAKVCNRSSTSTESTASSPNGKSKDCSEILDEVNGQFRRSSEDSDVTIMLVTDNSPPQKDTTKQLKGVNISESLSISLVDKPSTELTTECLGSNLNDHNSTNSSSKNLMLRPTARKTFPSNSTSQNKPNESRPPPLINLRDQTKVYEINKVKKGNPSPGPKTSGSKTSIGPVSAKLQEISGKVTEKVLSLFEEMLREHSERGNSEATIISLKLERERIMFRHRQEIAELKHNADLQISENRASCDAEKQRALLDAKHKYEIEKEAAVNEAKLKMWCNMCYKEAVYYCCWSTAYCSENCQKLNWPKHQEFCLYKLQHKSSNSDESEANRLGSSPQHFFDESCGQVGYL